MYKKNIHILTYVHTYITYINASSTAQGSGGSFKDRKLYVGEVSCCDAWGEANKLMDRKVPEALRPSPSLSPSLPPSLPPSLSLSLWSPSLSVSLSLPLSIYLSVV